MKSNLRLFLMLFLFSTYWVVNAQQRTISGTVTSSTGETLPGVSIVIDGTANGTITDFDGNYQLQVASDQDVLVYSFIGFDAQKISVSGQSTINVVLLSSVQDIDEVVVVGYGSLKKSDLTGAVTKVDGDDLKGPSTPDAVQALQGKVAGVNITPTSGEPGAGMKINIRGTGSWSNSSPLYVVDGFPMGDLSSVDPANIASIEILKDASATAIYGSRGANGVVLVSTKKGSSGKTVFEVSAYGGAQWASNTIDMVSASDFAMLRKEAYANDGKDIAADELRILDYAISNNSKGTDWQDEMFRIAPIQNYSISARGGSENHKYNIGATYFNQEGIIKNSGMQKFYAYMNNQYKFSPKVTLDANVSYSTYKKNNHNNDDFSGALPVGIRMDPLTPAWDDFTNNYGARFMGGVVVTNPARAIDASKDQTQGDHRVISNFTLNIDDVFVEGLSFRTMGAAQLAFYNSKNYYEEYYIAVDQRNDLSSLYEQRGQNIDLTWNGYFNYVKQIEKHSINATLGSEIQQFSSSDISGTRFDIPGVSELMYFDQSKDPSSFSLNGSGSMNRIMSYFARANYSFDNKYLLTATIRADGSSKFHEDNRWGYFPSFSAGWNIKQESFMQDVETLSRLKFRGGWGQVGNANAVEPWGYLSLMDIGYTYVIGGSPAEGAKAAILSNEDLRWEVSEQLNVGLDIGLFDQKLDITLDWFDRKTNDMQISRPIPFYVGAGRPVVNAASMKNSGFEFAVGWSENKGDFSYGISVNGAFVKQEITDMAGGEAISGGRLNGWAGNAEFTTRTETGYEIGYFYGLETDGIFTSQEEVDAHVGPEGTLIQPNAQVGDVKFLDKNGDGVIDGEDRNYLGSAAPDFSGGLNLDFAYKGLDFKASFVGVFGNEIVNGINYWINSSGVLSNYRTDRLDRWSSDNPNGTEPRMTVADANQNNRFSDRYVEDGSYVRLRNVQLGYTLPKSFVESIKLSKVRLYVSCDNLLTFTKYSSWTPEVGNLNGANLAPGVDYATYPTPVILTGGINVNF
ncbi:SusC/RagA family TonB-linked outer membrane protein [Saccharicrinis aurantiacus]|uniref:SusC/RagA family TonB-linked outer membrane protein n=1 Tax=Saccharicrinis aurantiacus TaxID=1849719 RepID=UPI00094FD666|nr:TonB-dependent receptor [Saccharicrinis aurantiacus]